jgi:hypothetical protein
VHVKLSSAALPLRTDISRNTAVQWTALDTVLMLAVTILTGALRLDGITHPAAFVFDEF